MEKRSFGDLLTSVPPRVIYLVLVIIMVVMIMNPLGLPLTVSPGTEKIYRFFEDLPEDSVIVEAGGNAYGWLVETESTYIAVLKHIFSRPLRLIVLPTSPDHVMYSQHCIDVANPDNFGKKYGEDYVILEYVPGGTEIVAAAFCKSIPNTVSADIYGTPLSELPVMEGVETIEDIDLWLYVDGQTYPPLRQVWGPYQKPIIGLQQASYYASQLPFVASGQIYGMTMGIRGGAEYEKLLGYKGIGTTGTDVLSSISVFMIILVILGNLGYQQNKRELRK